MSESNSNIFGSGGNNGSANCPKEAVCIDVMRVYDSCGNKDCLEDLPVLFSPAGQQVIDRATNVKIRNTDILNVYVDLEPVPFHKGYYSVNITFYFSVLLDVFLSPAAMPVPVNGLAMYTKQLVMYGSEGSVKVYSSDTRIGDPDSQNCPIRNLPKASVQTAEPIGLSARLTTNKNCCKPCCHIPENITSQFGGELCSEPSERNVLVSIGLFTIVQIVRNVQMLVHAYDFCVPCKECTTVSDSPCELFSKIDFPTDEFFPVAPSCRCDPNNNGNSNTNCCD